MTSPLGGLPRPPLFDGAGNFTPAWAGWLNWAQIILSDASNAGTTAQRPTSNQYVGKPYFDTTLAIPIWLKTPGSSPVWVNASGSPV